MVRRKQLIKPPRLDKLLKMVRANAAKALRKKDPDSLQNLIRLLLELADCTAAMTEELLTIAGKLHREGTKNARQFPEWKKAFK
jgi:hypothetical protein